VNHYAASKVAMEHLAAAYGPLADRITRPFNYTGVGSARTSSIPKLVEHFADSQADHRTGQHRRRARLFRRPRRVEAYLSAC
jgi:nucleoside-diphosphate-sugar epimerase